MVIEGTGGLSNTANSTNYIIPWNLIRIQNSSAITGDLTNDNFLITDPGLYVLEVRYASFDLFSTNGGFMRMQLRSSPTPITTSTGGVLVSQLNPGFITTTGNGEAFRKETVTILNEGPTYYAVTFLHSGATGTGGGGNTGFPVFNNNLGTQPYIFIRKASVI